MRIVIEGADLTGKSTLVNNLKQLLDMPGRDERIVKTGNALEAQQKDFEKHTHHILDRCYWISDLVYEGVYHPNEVSPMTHHISEFTGDAYTMYVFLLASKETLEKRFALRGDDIQSIENILSANEGYKNCYIDLAMDFSSSKWIAVCIDDYDTPESLAARVHKEIIRRGGVKHESN